MRSREVERQREDRLANAGLESDASTASVPSIEPSSPALHQKGVDVRSSMSTRKTLEMRDIKQCYAFIQNLIQRRRLFRRVENEIQLRLRGRAIGPRE